MVRGKRGAECGKKGNLEVLVRKGTGLVGSPTPVALHLLDSQTCNDFFETFRGFERLRDSRGQFLARERRRRILGFVHLIGPRLVGEGLVENIHPELLHLRRKIGRSHENVGVTQDESSTVTPRSFAQGMSLICGTLSDAATNMGTSLPSLVSTIRVALTQLTTKASMSPCIVAMDAGLVPS